MRYTIIIIALLISFFSEAIAQEEGIRFFEGTFEEALQKAVEEDKIEELFLSVAEGAIDDNDDIREVFSILVKRTLKYRDGLIAAQGITVKVKDVREALDKLVPALLTGKLPESKNKISMDLLKLWLDDLKRLGNPHRYLKG